MSITTVYRFVPASVTSVQVAYTSLATAGGPVAVVVYAPQSLFVDGTKFIGPTADGAPTESRSTSPLTTASLSRVQTPSVQASSLVSSAASSASQSIASAASGTYPASLRSPDSDFCGSSRLTPGERTTDGITQQWLCGGSFEGQAISGATSTAGEYSISTCYAQCWQVANCVAANVASGTCQRFSSVDSFVVTNGSNAALLYPSRANTTFEILPSTSSRSASQGGLSTGAKAGIAVGAVVVAAALIGLLIWIVLLKRRLSRSAPKTKRESLSNFEAEQVRIPSGMQETSEVPKAQSRVELDAERRPDTMM